MPDIFLYAGEASVNDVKLSDPTVVRSGGGGPTYFGTLKRWNGSIWVKGKLKAYVSGSFIAKPTKRWSGAEWKLIDATGI